MYNFIIASYNSLLLILRTLIWGTQSGFHMFVKKKRNRSGSVSVVVAEKLSGKYTELITIDISSDESKIESLVMQGKELIEHIERRGIIVYEKTEG